MKIVITNGAPSSLDTNNNLLNCKLQALISYQPGHPDQPYNNFITANHPSQVPPLRRIRTSIPPPIIISKPEPINTFSSPSSTSSPCVKSPWAAHQHDEKNIPPKHCLIGTLIREDGHVYSMAAAGNLLYTGSESKNIRVWKNMEEFSAFKSSSGLVKAIIVSGEKIFTGHQDGKVRIWKFQKKASRYSRVGNLPTPQDLIVKSMNPRNYVEVRRKRNVPWIKHYDAVSCLSIDTKHGILYSGSWDKTLKVWSISDSKCLESIPAHDDAVNAVAVGFSGLVFTGSADGTVKAWRRGGKVRKDRTKHMLLEVLLKQEHALTSMAVWHSPEVAYAGSSDGLVYFWEREEGGGVCYGGVLRGHKMAVLCVSLGGRLVASGSADKSIWYGGGTPAGSMNVWRC